jgi:hypothetical protein
MTGAVIRPELLLCLTCPIDARRRDTMSTPFGSHHEHSRQPSLHMRVR